METTMKGVIVSTDDKYIVKQSMLKDDVQVQKP